MSTAAADRNLLLGIIALQMDFVGRDALIAAMHAWVLNKGAPLSQILQDQGALTASRCSLLDALVQEHLRLHDDDPRKSLAALSSIGSARDELSRVADPDVQASLACVSAARKDPDDPHNTVTSPSLGASTSAGTRFRILRSHAKGGLGQVSVALDQELDRQVALKEIQDRHADDPESRARFAQEAEITGKLEHPGIIPVYGLGHDLTGRPFYAMRFIQGDSLKEAIARFHADGSLKKDPAQRSARLRELLRRFTDVCNAIAYAHSRGVLHRDLKPGNIMLGPYGETLVVDWGLAKPLGESLETPGNPAPSTADSASPASLAEGPIRLSGQSGSRADTVAGSPIGTPAFASPEQMLGRLDLLGPASDVYGLGATLYALLTGRAPVDSPESDEVLRRVSKGDIPPPRSIDPEIPRPLEAICRKAMALKPEDRYDSARALAEDVKRWMDDTGVSAYREPVMVRATRWIRRHQRLVTGAAATVLVGVTALGIAYTRESAINRELRHAQRESDRRLDQTLQAVEDYYTGVGAEVLLGQQEFQDLRARLLEKPRQFYEQLAKELETSRSPDERTMSLLAKGRSSLGLIYRTLSRFNEARAQHESATALLRDLAARRPALVYRESWAKSEYDLGISELGGGDYRASEASFRKALGIWTELARAHPDSPAYSKGLADCHVGLGTTLHRSGDTVGAAASFREAYTIWATLVDSRPDVPAYLWGWASCAGTLGLLQHHHGDLPGAARSLDQAIAIYGRLLGLKPDIPLYQNGLVVAHTYLGTVRGDMGELPGAAQAFRQAIAMGTKLTAAQPNVLDYQDALANGYTDLGVVQERSGDPTGAAESFHQTVTLYVKMAASHPAIWEYQRGLAYGHKSLGGVRRSLGDLNAASESFHKSIEIFTRLRALQPNIPYPAEGLGDSYLALGALQRQNQDYRGASDSYQQALALYDSLSRDHPEVPRYRFSTADASNELGELHRQTDRLDEALRYYERARTIMERLVKEQPQVLNNKKDLAGVLTNIGLVDMAQGRRLQGLRRFQEALTYWKEPFANNPRDPFFSAGLKEAPKALSNFLGSKKPQETKGSASPSPGPAAKKP